MNITETLGRQSKFVLVSLGICLLLGAAAVDVLAGPEFETAIFYVVPTSYFGWFFRRAIAIPIAIISAATTLAIHFAEPFRYSHRSIAYWNAAVWLVLYIFFALIISELRTLYERERQSSHTDSLTQIANRRAFFEVLEAEMNRASRYRAPLTLAYLDIDRFKQVNDTFGHAAGDKLLTVVAQTVEAHLRKADRVARLGGDEFAVLLPEITAEAATTVLHKLHSLLNESMQSRDLPVTFSIGAVTFHSAPASIPEMLSKADEAMYAAKNSGRNCVIVREAAA
jgi:diguanylate cyclase (GGDEF)-like protein